MANNRPVPITQAGGPRGMQVKAEVKDHKKALKRLWKYLSEKKMLLVLAFICIIINSSFTIIATYLLRPIINGVVLEEGLSALMEDLMIMACVYIVAVICYYLQSRIMLYVAQGSLKQLRSDLYNKLQKLPLRYFDSNNNGDLMSRFSNDVDAISQMLSTTCVQIVSGVITLTTTVIIMFYTNVLLTVLTLLILPVFSYLSTIISKKSMHYYGGQQKVLGRLNGFIEESITGQKVVKVFNHEEEMLETFDEFNMDYTQKSLKAQFLSGTLGPIMGSLSSCSYMITAFAGAMLCIYNGFDIGGYTIFVAYSKSFSRPINDIFMQINTVFAALAGAERVFEVMDEEPEVANMENCINNIDSVNQIVFDHISFGYHKDKLVLKDISLKANVTQKIAFVGSTGAGKTTITNLINRFYDIEDGDIMIDGVSIKEFNKDVLRQNIAMVLQDTHLFTGTVMENIRYGRLDATNQEVIEAAKTANADRFIRRLENGYDTLLEGDGANLSQGQRQLLNIARAAISKAPILVLDEATSSVDTRTERHIEQALDRLMENRTTFVIAHRLSTVRNSDQIFVLEHGQIIESGDHEQLLALKGKYYSLYTGKDKLD
ncbi:ABC transporter ATP-binding protein [Tannockella kyphosi]|uniref:ABC transporter ATP-binding protein n=1 Tax=Tannockella kyphosi TaxID=2899121 RepID=UPI002012DA7F|nr:ABC transporter ATP-binding protein [Tannockella kyphosi]